MAEEMLTTPWLSMGGQNRRPEDTGGVRGKSWPGRRSPCWTPVAGSELCIFLGNPFLVAPSHPVQLSFLGLFSWLVLGVSVFNPLVLGNPFRKLGEPWISSQLLMFRLSVSSFNRGRMFLFGFCSLFLFGAGGMFVFVCCGGVAKPYAILKGGGFRRSVQLRLLKSCWIQFFGTWARMDFMEGGSFMTFKGPEPHGFSNLNR